MRAYREVKSHKLTICKSYELGKKKRQMASSFMQISQLHPTSTPLEGWPSMGQAFTTCSYQVHIEHLVDLIPSLLCNVSGDAFYLIKK